MTPRVLLARRKPRGGREGKLWSRRPAEDVGCDLSLVLVGQAGGGTPEGGGSNRSETSLLSSALRAPQQGRLARGVPRAAPGGLTQPRARRSCGPWSPICSMARGPSRRGVARVPWRRTPLLRLGRRAFQFFASRASGLCAGTGARGRENRAPQRRPRLLRPVCSLSQLMSENVRPRSSLTIHYSEPQSFFS